MKIISAGLYRSGSTYLFNAIRLLCDDTYSTFVHKKLDYDTNNPKDIHLIKCHKYMGWLSEEADVVITIYRDIREVKDSMIRRQLVKTAGFTNETRLDLFDIYHHNAMLWMLEADLIIDYRDVIENPVKVLRQITQCLVTTRNFGKGADWFEKQTEFRKKMCRTDEELKVIAEELKNMKVPKNGNDPVTLLHENHITKKTW